MKHSENLNELFTALSKFNETQGAVKKTSTNPFLKNKYANLDALIEATKENLSKNGLSVIQLLTNDGVETILTHNSGQWLSEVFKIEPTNSKGTNGAQEMGIAITYARRYAYGSILNLATDEDTDGADNTNKQGVTPPIKKQDLTPAHVKWDDAIKALKAGKVTIDKVKETYNLTKDHEEKLLNQSK